MNAVPLYRFCIPASAPAEWVLLHREQFDAVMAGERRVVEGRPRQLAGRSGIARWYFNDSGLGLLRIEREFAPPGPAEVIWEGRTHDAFCGSSETELAL